MDDVQLVTDTYARCWQRRSRGRSNRWVEGRLHPLARRCYLVVNATERCLTGGVPSLLDDARFTLAETAEAYDSFGLPRHAAAIRALADVVDDSKLSHNRRKRAGQLNGLDMPTADLDRLNRQFPMSQADENEVWAALAKTIREHPDAFPPAGDAL